MAKKRGGKRHRAKKTEEAAAEDDSTQAEESPSGTEPAVEDAEETKKRTRSTKQEKPDVSEYFAHIKQLIEDCPFQGDIQFEAFVTSTVEEIIKRGLLVISDQKCSRVVEKLIALLANFIAFQEGGRRPAFGSGESSEEEKLQSRLRCLDSYLSLFRSIAPVSPDLATHPNGSHVLQTLLNSVPAVVEFERQHRKGSDEQQTVQDFFIFMLGKLKSEGGGWLQTMCSSTGTHIFRSAVRAAAGIDCLVPAEVAGYRTRRRTRKDCEETLTSKQVSTALSAALGKAGQSARLAKVPKSFLKELIAMADVATKAIEEDPFYLPFDVYAAPSLQVLMLALQAKQEEEALCRLLDAVFCFSKNSSSTEDFIKIADALVDSPTGSRILEVAITLVPPERFQMVFAHWMVKKLNELAQGRFGNFVLQKVLQSPIFQAAHLKQFVQTLNFGDCLFASTSAVLWRCAEACRRLQSSYKDFAKKMFEAVGAKGGSSTPYVWWCLLALCTPEDLPSELVPDDDNGEDSKGNNTQAEPAGEESEVAPTEASRLRLQDICTPSGCSIVMCLLKFPPATVQPLNAGFKKFVKTCRDCKLAVKKWKGKGVAPDIEVHSLLELMASNKLASRLIQEIVDPASTGLQPSVVQYMIRSLLPFLPSLALDAVGGFVLTSVYSGATPELKRQIVEGLLPIEDQLKAQNYAAYMKCEVYRYTKNKEEWQARQEKRSKTRDLFKDILATPAVEAEETIEENPLPEALTADPIAKQLLVDTDLRVKKQGAESKKKKRKNSDSAPDIASDAPADAEAVKEIDNIFLEAFDEKQAPSLKKKRMKEKKVAAGVEGSDARVATQPQAEVETSRAEKDPMLDAALFFIEGTSKTMSKRELARRRKLEVEKLEAAEPHAAEKKVGASGRKKK